MEDAERVHNPVRGQQGRWPHLHEGLSPQPRSSSHFQTLAEILHSFLSGTPASCQPSSSLSGPLAGAASFVPCRCALPILLQSSALRPVEQHFSEEVAALNVNDCLRLASTFHRFHRPQKRTRGCSPPDHSHYTCTIRLGFSRYPPALAVIPRLFSCS